MPPLMTIYFTSDTHGYLYPATFADQQAHPMGLLSIDFPKDGNTLVLDGGDTIQGSPLIYFCRTHGRSLPVADVMNKRGYDYVTLGNHDFNNGMAYLADYLHRLNATALCANVHDQQGRLPLKNCAVHTLENGLRVGLIGLVTNWVNRWEKPENIQDVTISDPLEAAREAVAALRGQADILVGIYHGGLEKDTETGRLLSDTDENIACRLAEELPFDLLLTGHQHVAMANINYCGTHMAQTPSNASAYIKVTMEADGTFRSELCPVADHAVLSAEEEVLWQDVNAWLDKPIGHLTQAIWPEDKLTMAMKGSPIADFFNQVQLEVSHADISCTALGNDIRGFNSDVTVRDVVASYVYSNTLVVLEVTGQVLRQALEQCATYFAVASDGSVAISEHFLRPKQAHYNYDYFSGIDYRFDLSKPVGQRVAYLVRDGKPIEADDRFTLCMNNYRATGTGDFDFYRSCPVVKEIQTDISELILDYFRVHPLVQVAPSAPIVQP